MTSVGPVRLFRAAVNVAVTVAILVAVMLVAVGSVFVISWTAIQIHDRFWGNDHRAPVEACWVEDGPGGLEHIHGSTSYKPQDAVEVPCS